MQYFKAIAAMSENRVIGRDNKIPWHLPEDFKWFKRMTTGNIVVMGRKTFESIGKPLPNRETFVLSRTGFQHPGVRTIRGLEEIEVILRGRPGFSPSPPSKGGTGREEEARLETEVFLCGGAEIYAQGLPRCSDLFLTLVKRTVDGDAFFPTFEDRFEPVETLEDNPDFQILHYRNRAPVLK